MFRKDKPITLKGSTSFLCNNLSVYVMPEKKQLNYAVVHKSVVNIACATTDGTSVTGRQVACKEPSAAQGLPFVMQSKWVILPSRTVLVLTTHRGIQIYEPDGSAMIYWHALSDSMDKSNYGKGICGAGDNLICVGTESGAILVFEIPPKGTNVTLFDTVKGHKSPITDLAAEGEFMVSADDLGTIMVWRCSGSKFSQVSCVRGCGWPCNSVAVWKDVVVGGFSSGHIRVYNAASGTLGAEVTAHARSINAVHVACESGMLLTVSDDTFLKIWQLKTGAAPQIEHRYSECVTDLQLVGGNFVDKQGRAVCITGYDSNEIQFFIKG
ncbi:WD repeat-containing protein 54 [Aplysia californica]|uniref:WD repeat-containing protein 54 n=1 Tax=Aplysia californica TaxID=6500 RepID=A0ABM0JA47_APLCA|nr:WD repeat-containing protein 54 [Aplysia californica]